MVWTALPTLSETSREVVAHLTVDLTKRHPFLGCLSVEASSVGCHFVFQMCPLYICSKSTVHGTLICLCGFSVIILNREETSGYKSNCCSQTQRRMKPLHWASSICCQVLARKFGHYHSTKRYLKSEKTTCTHYTKLCKVQVCKFNFNIYFVL